MEVVGIRGSRAELFGVPEIPELHVVDLTAIDREADTWEVSALVPDGAAVQLRRRGFEVETVKPSGQVESEWAAADATRAGGEAAEEAGVRGYLPSTAIAARLRELAEDHPEVCAVEPLPKRTHEGREVLSIRIGTGERADVVVLGGVHAREWAPPDALLSFVERLVGAYADGTALEYPAWQDTTASQPVTYAAWSLAADEVQSLVDGVTFVVVPLVNPDGRDFSLADAGPAELHLRRMWRKNRRPPAPGRTGPWCAGVDLNRNFELAWDYERYYTWAAAIEVRSSKWSCHPDVYIGSEPASEPETQNVQALVAEHRPSRFMDVHAYSRAFLFPWGMDTDQSDDPTQNYANPEWDREGPREGRDGLGGPYGEFLPADLLRAHQDIAGRMSAAIRERAGDDPVAARRSEYSVKQALGLYPTTGTSDDWVVAIGMQDGSQPPIIGFCMECGIEQSADDPEDNEGGFHPDYVTKFPKIEREVHAAVLALAQTVARGD